ncbi:MAG: topoisomerase DNA-binding C4 zinc finger domain-containing protein [archaeon]
MKCAQCGNTATKINSKGIPVCSQHLKTKFSAPKCPNCGIEMKIREGKYGKFWGCVAFPMCDGIRKL